MKLSTVNLTRQSLISAFNARGLQGLFHEPVEVKVFEDDTAPTGRPKTEKAEAETEIDSDDAYDDDDWDV